MCTLRCAARCVLRNRPYESRNRGTPFQQLWVSLWLVVSAGLMHAGGIRTVTLLRVLRTCMRVRSLGHDARAGPFPTTFAPEAHRGLCHTGCSGDIRYMGWLTSPAVRARAREAPAVPWSVCEGRWRVQRRAGVCMLWCCALRLQVSQLRTAHDAACAACMGARGAGAACAARTLRRHSSLSRSL